MASTNQTTARIAVRNALWFSIGSYLIQFIAFIATIFLTRMLGPTAFGLFSMGTFWVGILTLEPKFGVYYAAVQHPRLDGELLGTYLVVQLGLAAGSFLISIVGAIVLTRVGYAAEIGLILIFMVGLSSSTAIVSPMGMALDRELQLSRQTLGGILASVLAYCSALVAASLGAGLWSLLILNLVSTLTGIVMTYLVCRQRLPQVFQEHWHFSRVLAKQLIRHGLPVGMSNVATNSVINQFDNFLIGTFINATELGFYDRAFRISQWPNILLTLPVTKLGLLTFAKVMEDLPRLTASLRLALWILTSLGPAIALFLLLGATDILDILLTNAWTRSAYYLQFLAVYSFLSPFTALAYSLGIARGDRKFIITLTSIEAGILVLIGTLLTLWQGSIGTVTAVGLMNLVGFGLSCSYIFQVVPLNVKDVFGKAALATILALVVTLGVERIPGWSELQTLVRLIVIGFTGPGIFFATLFLLNPAEMIERVSYLVRTFRKPKPAAPTA